MPHGKEEILDPVPPGTILRRIPRSVDWDPGNLEDLSGRVIHTEVPARIHLSVLDMTRFSPGHPGGGGLGYAIRMYARSEVRIREVFVSDGDDDSESGELDIRIDARRSSIVEHVSRVFLKHLGLSGSLEVMGAGHDINHMGLGSTSALVTSVALSLNHALGEPFTQDEVRAVIGYNFMEEWEGGLVIPGFETGVGPYVGMKGGFGILSDRLWPVTRFELPEEYEVVIALIEEEMPDILVESRNAGISETELLMNRARALDERDRAKKTYEVLMRLIPAGDAGDLPGVGESVWNLQRLGSKIAEIEHHLHARDIYETMGVMREHGSVITGMSSVGPAISALVVGGNGQGEELAEVIRERGYRVILTGPDCRGARIGVKP